MAIPSTYPFPLANDPFVDVSTHGYYWFLGGNNTINWSISDGLNGEFWNNPSQVALYVEAALETFSTYINVDFNFTGYFSSPQNAYVGGSDINVSIDGSNWIFNNANAWGRAFFPSSENDGTYLGAPGDVYINLNSAANSLESYDPGSAGWFLLIHELGHALGLKHTHDSGGTGRPTISEIGLSSYDNDWTSIMSYQDDYSNDLLYFDPSTPMLFDVIGLQYIYGANLSTNAGDSMFTLSKTGTYQTIWDPSGLDTVDASTSSEGWDIVLPVNVGTNSVGYATPLRESALTSPFNFYWLMGDIEIATGSEYSDRIEGNYLNNFIDGNRGDDFIDGAEGIDFAYYSGDASNYLIYNEASRQFIRGDDGVDEIVNIERLIIDDAYVAIDIEGNGGKAYRIYQAAFDRTPDSEGVGYWIAQLDFGMDLTEVSTRFIDSDEFRSIYGSNPTDSQFLEGLYQNVLDRTPDVSGFDWWSDQLENNPDKTRAKVLADFSESPENHNSVDAAIENGFVYDLWV